ncbi:hypothetical protein CYMTET_9022 [Cymbomonas tetramitiformis]|uniref:Uncharacterized protein n=1 Tax=Cymbomonas tetramitiformis TaxID=36881 RepID=A0AAE0LFJ4_9CHLO|nr:hypothetical protein CYMTET_9021 [Cymbomonas tetramitiformis]KAK3283278.1 hypothetical protein CYMTET_9022 [Cymbomonas tetramitiformis]|eukprot:gene1918-2600_t
MLDNTEKTHREREALLKVEKDAALGKLQAAKELMGKMKQHHEVEVQQSSAVRSDHAQLASELSASKVDLKQSAESISALTDEQARQQKEMQDLTVRLRQVSTALAEAEIKRTRADQQCEAMQRVVDAKNGELEQMSIKLNDMTTRYTKLAAETDVPNMLPR